MQSANTEALCASLVAVAEDECPALLPNARAAYIKFARVFSLFAKCHYLYNGSRVTEEDIDQLGTYMYTQNYICCERLRTTYTSTFIFAETNIQEFMAFYRKTFPRATVLPKMHVLEEHTVPWMRRWHIGAGMMGEQGAESIHAHFQHLERIYAGIPNALKRMEWLMKEHYIETDPSTASLCPEVKRRKKN